MQRFRSGLFLAAALAAFGLCAMASTEARAGYNVVLTGPPTPVAGGFLYSYTASITANSEQVVAGNFFRLYDFYGYVAGSATAPANWTIAVANSNPTPPPNVILQHGDDPAVPNLTFTYNGATPLTGPVSLGTFTAVSIYGIPATVKDFAGQSTNTGTTPPSIIDSRGDYIAPAQAVPEPASILSTGVGLALLGLGFVARKRSKVDA